MKRKPSTTISITDVDKSALLKLAELLDCYRGEKPCLSALMAKIARDEINIKPQDRDRTIAELREEVILLKYKLLSVKAIVG